MKTEKDEYLDLMEDIRETRKVMLKKLMPENEGMGDISDVQASRKRNQF